VEIVLKKTPPSRRFNILKNFCEKVLTKKGKYYLIFLGKEN